MPDTPTPHELVELLGAVSLAATGQGWHPQTSNAAWFLVRYGGHWRRAAADDLAAELDRADEISAALDAWPIQGAAAPDADGVPSLPIDMTGRRAFREARIHVEHGGVVVAGSAKHLQREQAGTDPRTVCGLALAGVTTRRLARPRRDPSPWCAACAAALAQDLGGPAGWSADRPA